MSAAVVTAGKDTVRWTGLALVLAAACAPSAVTRGRAGQGGSQDGAVTGGAGGRAGAGIAGRGGEGGGGTGGSDAAVPSSPDAGSAPDVMPAPDLQGAGPDAPGPRDVAAPTVDVRPAADVASDTSAAPPADTRPPPDQAPDLAPGPPMDGLIGYWRLDETQGLTATDGSGNANHGALMEFDAPTWRPGKRGGALALDGQGNWVKAPRSASIDGITSAFTIAVWVQRASSPSGFSNVVSRQWQMSGSEQYGLGFIDGVPNLVVASNQAGNHLCKAAAVAPTGTWTHLAGTFDGTTARLYVDGVQVCSLPRALALSADTASLIIGGNANDATDDVQELFGGLVDEVLLYRRALGAPEIAALAR